MENYEKGETIENETNHREPFQHILTLREETPVITVRGGSKIQSLLDVALSKMNEENSAEQKFIVFYGAGPAINKTVSCVEIFKRRVKNLHQINKLFFEEVQEIWNPKIEGLNVLKVSRKIPVLHVLLSKEPLPTDEPGQVLSYEHLAMVGYDPEETRKIPHYIYGLSGALSGFVTRFLTQPLDVCKIRFQLQIEPINRGSPLSKYRSLPQACSLIIREEGVTALWKGIIPGQALSVMYGLAEFATFEFLNRSMFALGLITNPKDPFVYFICGSIAGMAGTLASQPLDVVRTRLVSQGRDKVYVSVVDSFKQIRQHEGYRGFYRGLLPALLQVGPASGLSFAFYSKCQSIYRNWSGKRVTQGKSDTMESLVCGFVAGAASKSTVHPLDVLKKRLQVQGFERGRKGFGLFLFTSGLMHLVKETYRLEGVHGFFKGFSPALLKAAFSTGFTFFFYEQFLRGFSSLYQ